MPFRLKQSLDANDAGVDAQRGAAANQAFELDRINKLHDVELARLRRLWAGEAPGSLGPVLMAPGPAPAQGGGQPSSVRNAGAP